MWDSLKQFWHDLTKKDAEKDSQKQTSNRIVTHEDLDFVADSKAAMLLDNPRFTGLILYTILSFLFVALVWASFAEVSELTRADGKVVPSSQVQVIQSLEGGILEEIFVTEGEIVDKTQTLLRIDETQAVAAYKRDYATYLGLISKISRLKSELAGHEDIVFPEILHNHTAIMEREENLFEANKELFASNIQALQDSYKLISRELEITRPLVKKGVMSELELLQLERNANDIKGQLDEKDDLYKQSLFQELENAEVQLSSLQETLLGLEDRMIRTTIRSPVRGIIHTVNITTTGGVIKPGMDILEIVPLEDKLVVEAKVRPADIAFIHPEQAAVVKFSAYDFAIYGGLAAKVTHISPDTVADEEGNSFYEVKLETERNYLGESANPLRIIPGMQVTVDIVTGHKTVLDYLLKPILRAKEKALRER